MFISHLFVLLYKQCQNQHKKCAGHKTIVTAGHKTIVTAVNL